MECAWKLSCRGVETRTFAWNTKGMDLCLGKLFEGMCSIFIRIRRYVVRVYRARALSVENH